MGSLFEPTSFFAFVCAFPLSLHSPFLYTFSNSLASFTSVSRQIKARFYILITTGRRGEEGGELRGGGGVATALKINWLPC